MTIETTRSRLRTCSAATGVVAIVAAGWLGVVLGLTFFSPAGNAMAIVGLPEQAFAAVTRANGRVLSAGRYVTIARSDDAGFVAQLYAAGALLVLDAEQAGGCSGMPARRVLRMKQTQPSSSYVPSQE
jgi:hypothetical protein